MEVLWPDDSVMQSGTVVVPQGPGVWLGLSGSYGGSEDITAGDSISIVPSSKSCQVGADFADAASGDLTAVILDNSARAFFDFSQAKPGAGYQICVCPVSSQLPDVNGKLVCSNGAAFTDSNPITVQDRLVSFIFKGQEAAHFTVPIQFCGEMCTRVQDVNMAYRSGPLVNKNSHPYSLSIIPVSWSCNDARQNVQTPGLENSGYLLLDESAAREVIGIDYITKMTSGTYKVCQKPDSQAVFNWVDSGISVVLQDQVVGIQVNEIFGFVASTPNVAGVPIHICKTLNCSQSWASADRISFIPHDADCRDDMANPPTRGEGVSGHMRLTSSGALLQQELDPVLESALPVGKYVLCFDVSQAGFQRSGLVLMVQDQVLGFEVNGVMPNNGLRVSVPNSPGTAMQYLSRSDTGVAGDSVAFIAFESECGDLCLTVQIQACDPSKAQHFAPSAFLSAHGDDKRIGNSSCFGNHEDFQFACSALGEGNRETDFSRMQPGRYKACFRPASVCAFQTCWPVWAETGVVLEVQDHATSFRLNFAGGIDNPAHGQRLVAPRRDYHKLEYVGTASGEIAFQKKEVDCADEEQLAALVEGVTAPMHEFDQAQVDLAMGGAGLLGLDTFQICFRPEGGAGYLNTGVSLRLQNYIDGLDVNGVRANGGLRTVIPIETSSRLTMFRTAPVQAGDAVSLIGIDKACWHPSQNPPSPSQSHSGHLNLTFFSVHGGSIALLSGSDAVAGMGPGWYQVCFRSNSSRAEPLAAETAFTETGLTVRLQRDLTSLRVNARFAHWRAMGSNRGVRVALPKTSGNSLVASHAGTLSFIHVTGDCADVVNDNPSRDSERRPQWLDAGQNLAVSRQSLDILLSGDKAGLLQVCHAAPSGAGFASTGLSLMVQEEVLGLVVNEIRPNFGIRVALPRRQGNTAYYQGGPGDTDGSGSISLVDMFGDCSLPSDNPAATDPAINASGPLATSSFVVGDTSVIGGLNPGEYQVCFQAPQASTPGATGLTLLVQQQVLAMQVNRVNKISSATPRVPESEIAYCRDVECLEPGYPAAAISFIQGFQECEDQLLQNPSRGAAGRSGYFALDNTTRAISPAASASMLSEEGTLGTGSYQVCIDTGDQFLATGLSLLVQERVLGLEVNAVSPNYGLRIAVPRVQGTSVELSYLSPFLGSEGDAVSFIALTGTCGSPVDNPEAQGSGVSGHIVADGVTKVLVGTEVLASLDGQYQVCFRHGSGAFETTGLSATVQSLATGFSVDGASSLRANLEKGAVPADSTLLVEGPQADTVASFILPAKSCASLDENPPTATPAASGHLSVIVNGGVGEVQLNYEAMDHPGLIQELTYQLCITDADGGWRSTGISVTVRWKCLAADVSGVFRTLQVDESNNIAGAMNAVHVIMETEPRLPPGSVLRVEGLQGSLTADNAQLDVFGNSIRSETTAFPCQGNGSCVLDLDDYSLPGTIIFSASLSIELLCSDFDSCGESVRSVTLVSDAKTEDLSLLIDAGPWPGCIGACDKTVALIENHNVIDSTGKQGRPMQVRIMADEATNYHSCSGWTLFAQVKLTLQYSRLSTHSFFGSWTKSSGVLAVPFVPFEDSPFIHITFVLRNPTRPNIPRPRPVVSLCAIQSLAGEVPATMSETLLSTKTNVLKADLAPQFATAEIAQSSNFVNERNRIDLRLRTNLPALLPRGLSITIAGLTGTQTSDTSQLRLLDASQVSRVQYPCAGARSCTVTIDTRAASGSLFHRATLDVSLFCTDFRAYPTKFIREIRTCTKAVGATACPDRGSLAFPTDAYSRGPWQDCDACRQSTRPVMRSYDLTEVIGTFGSEFNMEIVASEGVGNLKCYASTTVQSVRAAVVLSIEYARNSGIWANQNGELVVTGAALAAAMTCTSSGDLNCFPQVSFSFELLNPPTEQAAVTPRLSAIGGGLIFPEQQLQSMLATSFRQLYVLTRATVGQTTRKKGEVGTQIGLNTLTVSITAEAPIPAGTRVTVSGLTGTQTEDEVCEEVAAPRCAANPPHCIFQSVETGPCHYGMQLLGEDLGSDLAGSWEQATGTLVFVVQSSFQAMRTITLSFRVYNSPTAQPAATATVKATNENGFEIAETRLEGEVLQSDEDNIPLEATAPEVLSAVVVENDKKEYQNNTIRVSALPNLPLSRGSLITLQGFKTSSMAPSMDTTWYSDALPNVESIAVAGSAVAPTAAWQDAVTAVSGWICEDGSWFTSVDTFDNRLINRQQSWCSVQPAYSVVTRLDSCVRASEDLTFSFTLRNDAIPPAIPAPPSIDIQSKGAQFPTAVTENLVYSDSRVLECSGTFSCILSFMHTPSSSCYEDSCRLLPPMARLLNATLSVDLACANFALRGQFVDRATACAVPDCAADYDSEHSWEVQSNACCVNGRNCQKYDCLRSVSSFETGPWQGCSGNCSDSRPVVRSYGVMHLLCADPASCYTPESLVFFMAISSAADVLSCSGLETYTQAKVTLSLQYMYESVAFASEIARLDVFDVQTSNDAQNAETDVTVRIQAQSPLGPGSTFNITGLFGSQSPDDAAVDIETLDCVGVDDRFCEVSATKIVAGTGKWIQSLGSLAATIETFVPLGQLFSFRFRLIHSATEQVDGQTPSIMIHSVTTGQQIVQQSRSVVLTAAEAPLVSQGVISQANVLQRQDNELGVTFRCNLDLRKGDEIVVSGLKGTPTKSGLLQVLFEGSGEVVSVSGQWNREAATLTVQLPGDRLPLEVIAFGFTLQNGGGPQTGTGIQAAVVPVRGKTGALSGELAGQALTATEIPVFARSRIREAVQVYGQMNHLEVTFQTSVLLPLGSLVIIDNLVGAETASSEVHPVTFQLEGCASSQDMVGNWDLENSKLSLFLPSEVATTDLVTLQFRLLNPSQPQTPAQAKLSAISPFGVLAFNPIGSVLGAALQASFQVAYVGQSSLVGGQASETTMQLKANIDIIPGMQLVVLGLDGLSVSSLDLFGPASPKFLSPAPYSAGILTLFPTEEISFEANGDPFVLRWSQDVPTSGSNTVTAQLFQGPATIIQDTVLQGTAVSTTLGSVTLAEIQEGSLVKLAPNTISVHLQFSFPLSHGAVITLTGMINSLTPDEGSLSVSGVSAVLFGNSGRWTQSEGSLELTFVAETLVPAGESIRVSFDIDNPSTENQAGAEISVQSQTLLGAPSVFPTRIMFASDDARFESAIMAEDNSVRTMVNQIQVTAVPNVPLFNDTLIQIKPLTGAHLDGDQVAISWTASERIVAALGSWNQSEKSVSFRLSEPVEANSTFVVTFDVINPSSRQSAIIATLSASGADPFGVPSGIERELTGSVLSSAESPGFHLTDLAESSKLAGGPNTISVVLQSNAILDVGAKLRLLNLVGSDTLSGEIAITEQLAANEERKLNATGRFVQGEGVLEMGVAARMPQDYMLSFSFVLLNSPVERTPILPEAMVEFPPGSVFIPRTAVASSDVVWNDGIERWRGDVPPEFVNGQILSASEGYLFTKATVREQNAVAGQPNTLYFTLEANSDMYPGARVTITGLRGSGSSQLTTSGITIGAISGDVIGRSWTPITGVLIIELLDLVLQGSELAFSAPIKNPSAAQNPVQPVILVTMVNPFTTLGITIPAFPIEPERGQKCCLSADDSPTFLSATVRESTAVKGQVNVLYFNLRSSIPLLTNTQITISNLLGSATFSTAELVLSNSTSLKADWQQNTGTLLFTLDASMYVCDCIDACQQNNLEFSVQLRNADREQRGAAARVSASREGLNGVVLESAFLTGEVLRASQDPEFFAAIFEASNVTGQLNTITVSLRANFGLEVCASQWNQGSAGWLDTANSVLNTDGEPIDDSKLFDGTVQTFVQFPQAAGQLRYLVFDLQEPFRLEAIRVISYTDGSGINEVMLQYGDSPSGPTWTDAMDGVWSVELGVEYRVSLRFKAIASRYWRLAMYSNHNPQVYVRTIIADISFFGCPDRETHAITLSNLTGTRTADNDRMQIVASTSLYGSVRRLAQWNQTLGSLFVKLDDTVKAFDELSFQFQVQNAAAAQAVRRAEVDIVDGVEGKLLPPPIIAVGAVLASNEESIFIVRDISENSQFQSDVNRLHIALEANVPLRGSDGTSFRIVFSGRYFAEMLPLADKTESDFLCVPELRANLPCLTGATRPAREGAFEVLFRASGATDIDPQYDDQEPSVIVKLLPTAFLAEGTRVELDVVVVNPARRQARGFSPSVQGSVLSKRVMNGEVMQAAVVGLVFSTRTLTETSRMALSQNVLTATLVPGTDLVQPTLITISGLQGTRHPDGINFPFETQQPAGILSSSYQFAEERLLVEVATPVWEAGTEVVLAWKMQNGEGKRAERIQIVANRGITIATAMCNSMDPALAGQCLQSTDVLNVDRIPGIVAAAIQQGNSVQGQQNLLTVSLLPNAEMLASSTITVSGLVGTATPDGMLSGLSGTVAHLLDAVSWVQATGELVLRSRGTLNSPASPGFSFSFFVTNAVTEHAKPAPRFCVGFSFASVGSCGLEVCDVVGISEVEVQSGSTNCTGKAPLNASDPLFLRSSGAVQLLVNEISESSNVPDQDNVITVRLSSNVLFRPGVQLSIHGLVASQTTDNTQLAVLVSNQQCVNSDTWSLAPLCPAVWRQQSMLVVPVGVAVPASTEVLTLSFVIRNPSEAQTAPAAAKLTADLGTAARFNAAPLSGSVLRADGAARLLRVDVSESTTVHRQRNLLTFTVTATVPLSQGSIVTVRGLRGHDVASDVTCNPETQTTPFSTELPPAEVTFGEAATASESFIAVVQPVGCELVTSTLTVALPRGYQQGEDIVFAFAVFNKLTGSNGTTPAIAISGCRAGLTPTLQQFCAHTEFQAPAGGSTCSSSQQLRGQGGCSVACPRCVGDSACAPCSLAGDQVDIAAHPSQSTILAEGTEQGFLMTSAIESTNAVSLLNTITVSLQLNVALEIGSRIRLLGFNQSQTESSELILFATDNDDASNKAFGANGTADWDQASGTLTLVAATAIPTAQVMVIDFMILNPGQQKSAVCLHGKNYCEENSRVFLGTGRNKGRECPEAGGICAGECQYRHPFCSSDNAVNCTATGPACPICISPNNYAYCPSTAMASLETTPKSPLLLPADAPNVAVECFPTATACWRETRCLAPNTNQPCDSHVQCTGPYDPDVPESDWVQRLGPQRCVRLQERSLLFSDVVGPRVRIASERMAGSVLGFSAPQPPAFLTKRISQSTRIPGQLNQLSIDLTANFPLSDMQTTRITISGFPGALTVMLSEFRSGPTSGEPVVALFRPDETPTTALKTGCGLLTDEAESTPEQRRDGGADGPVRFLCGGVGANLTSDLLYTAAVLNLRVECGLSADEACPPCREDQTAVSGRSCFQIQDVGLRDPRTGEEVPAGIGSFRSSPCVGQSTKCRLEEEVTVVPARPGVPAREVRRTKRMCMILDRLDVLAFLQAADTGGFGLELVATSPELVGLEAELIVTATDSFGRWELTEPAGNASRAQLVVNGAEAPLALVPDAGGRAAAFSFQVLNLEAPQASPVLTVVGASGLVKDAGLCVDEIDSGCEAFRKDQPPVPSTVRTRFSGSVLQSDRPQYLVVATVKESSGLPGRPNVLSVELSTNTNVTIPPGTRVTVSGLAGSLTPDSDFLAVVGTGTMPVGQWRQQSGALVVQLLSELGSFQAPLLFAFELINPLQGQPPVEGQVAMSGSSVYGPQPLVCITTPDCPGVLGAGTRPELTLVEVAEQHRYAGELNFVTWYIAASIPIQRDDVRVLVSGLSNVSWAPGPLPLARNPGEVQHAAECSGLRSCVLELPGSAPPGTIRTRSALEVTLACEGLLELQELWVCQTQVPSHFLLASTCVDPSKATVVVLADYDLPDCSREEVAVLARGAGTMTARGLLTLGYELDVSSEAGWEESLGALSVQVRRNTTAQSPTLLSPNTLAFSLAVRNAPGLQPRRDMSITVVWDVDGVAVNQTVAAAVLQSGVQRCSGIVVLNASGVSSDVRPDTTPTDYPAGGLSLYNEPAVEGEESCMVMVQPNNTEDWLVRIQLRVFDLDEGQESVTVYEGDSPDAVEIARIYFATRVNLNDAREVFADSYIWSQACTTTLRLRVTRQARPDNPFFGSVTSGKRGFNVRYSLVDPLKMDHLRANISLEGLLGPLDDEWSLLRMRKILGAANQVSHAFVIFDSLQTGTATPAPAPAPNASNTTHSNHTTRRSAEGVRLAETEEAMRERGRAGTGRRLLQTTSMTLETRVLANSPSEAVSFAKGLTQALFSRGVTVNMNNQGIVGSASLIGQVAVFRCGFELECVPAPPVTPVPVVVPPNITTTPEPFPLDEILRLSFAIVIGPIIVGICCCFGVLYYMYQDYRTKKQKTAEAIENWTTYLETRKKELLELDEYEKEKEGKRVFNKKLGKEEFVERVEELIKTHFNKMAKRQKFFKETDEFDPFYYKDYKWLPPSYYLVPEEAPELKRPVSEATADVVTQNGSSSDNEKGNRTKGVLENGNGDSSMDGTLMDENEPDPAGHEEDENDGDENDEDGAGEGTEEVHLAV